MGLNEPTLNRLIRSGYELLNLISFFTVGPKEAHAWTASNGVKAPQAAGKIHTDFEKDLLELKLSHMMIILILMVKMVPKMREK